MKRLLLILNVLPKLGIVSLCRLAWYRFKVKIGYFRLLLPIRKFETPTGPIFCLDSVAVQILEGHQSLITRADALLNGELLMFSHWVYRFKEYPEWHLDPINQSACPQHHHWTQTVVPDGADIKCIWELSRFEWAPLLARASCLTGDQKYIDTLNKFVGNWLEHNPVNQGVNWKCGQETSIRLVNILLTWWLLGKHLEKNLAPIVFTHLIRITQTLGYAVAQDNNHGTSEAAGLFIAGRWLAQHGDSEKQRTFGRKCCEKGRHWLEDRVSKLISEDGGFSQYSTNYHRVLLDTLSQVEFWRLEFNLPRFSEIYRTKVRVAIRWLLDLVEVETGKVVNLGANDGARLYSLCESNYEDFRPSLQLLSVLIDGVKIFDDPTCDEPLKWLGLDNSLPLVEVSQYSVIHPQFGTVVLRKGDLKAVVRFANFLFRPSHADCLHLDLFHRSNYLLRDSGSFSYHQSELHYYFSGTESHNTIQFDGHDQIPRLGKFIFSRWLKMDDFSEVCIKNNREIWCGTYRDSWGNRHTRRVSLGEKELTVEDSIDGSFKIATLRWRLMPGDWCVENGVVQTGSFKIEVSSVLRPELSGIVQGWESTRYLQKGAVPVFELRFPSGMNKIKTIITLK